MTARTLMVQGTTSSAGKSLLTAALCRIYARRGVRVAPFKAQNMSNNAAVCPDGAEIGRSTAVQAAACGLEPTADMNPILLKPESDCRSQVILNGRPAASLPAADYYARKREMWAAVTAALERLRAQHDLVIIEGAGSPVELNLRRGDIVNMAVARHAHSPVLLVGDIDRGGVFAQLLGTLWLLEEEERRLVRGLIVNKFRGDMALFSDGVEILEARGGVPVLGVVPWVRDLAIPEEDAVALDAPAARAGADGAVVDIAVIRLPHIANFDDFDPLGREAGVRVRYVASVAELGAPRAIVLPGTKSTMADLDWLRRTGLAGALLERAACGAGVVGICGGYQMLGRAVHDPDRVESRHGTAAGLGLLPVETVFAACKETRRAAARVSGGPGWLAGLAGREVRGYEIHMGRTTGGAPWLSPGGAAGEDGAVSEDGRVWGCYLHGLFEDEAFRRGWLASLGWRAPQDGAATPDTLSELDRLATEVEGALDMERLERIVWET
jgi:adenosylcobyric acid synthase